MPFILALTAASFVPLTVYGNVELPYEPLIVPYSNHAVVGNPLAFTVPFNIAELEVTFVAKPVVTIGGRAGTVTTAVIVSP